VGDPATSPSVPLIWAEVQVSDLVGTQRHYGGGAMLTLVAAVGARSSVGCC